MTSFKWQGFAVCLLLMLQITAASGQVVANFEAEETEGCNILELSLTNLSTGADTYLWQVFNSSGTLISSSTLVNPTFFLTVPDTYTVTLTATGPGGTDELTIVDYISVFTNPEASILVDPTSGCPPLEITATDISTPGSSGSITSFYWIITGAGSLPATPTIDYTFTEQGVYSIFLFVSDDAGCSDFTEVEVEVLDTPEPGFEADTSIACSLPLEVSFTDTTAGPGPYTYLWDFGDGSSSTDPNPVHNYTSFGNFNVTLTVTNAGGCSATVTVADFVQISPTIDIDFLPSVTVVCQGESIFFDNLSGSSSGDWLWDFGDGTTSTEFEPSHIYSAPGVYSVSLSADFGGGCTGDISYPALITINDAPEVSFTATDSVSVCELPLVVTFTPEVVGGLSSLLWEFEFGGGVSTSTSLSPTFSWTAEGTWDVTLTATNPAGCSTTYTAADYIFIGELTVIPTVDAAQGCIPMNASFSASAEEELVSFEWDFGDGSTSTEAAPSHVYSTPGCFDVSLIATSINGCSDTVTYFEFVCAGVPGAADFIVLPDTACPGVPIEVGFLPLDSIVAEIGGTGITSSTDDVDSISVINLPTGDNDLVVVAWNFGCPDTLTALVHVLEVVDSNNLVIQSCDDPLTVQIMLDTAIANLSCGWEWDFGDGTTDTVSIDPIHTYDAPGTYTVTITYFCITPEPCTGTGIEVLVTVPEALFENPPILCDPPFTVTFENLSTDGVSNLMDYSWDFGDGTTDSVQNPVHTFGDYGLYFVTLSVVDSNDCPASYTDTVFVNNLDAAWVATPSAGCAPLDIIWSDASNSLFGNIESWVVDWDDGNIDTFYAASEVSEIPYTYSIEGYYYVSVTVTDDIGCTTTFTDTILATAPNVDFMVSDSTPCVSQAVNFSELATGIGLSYLWTFGDGGTSTAANPVYTYTAEGIYDVSLTITDINGCEASITKPAFIEADTVPIDFEVDILVANCNYALVQFNAITDDSICTYSWDFGDGATSGSADPLYPYLSAGLYDVSLTLTNCNGCAATLNKEDFFLVPGPFGTLTPVEDTSCVGSIVELELAVTSADTATIFYDNGDIGNLDIDYSDEADTLYLPYTYTESGVYTVSVLLFDTNGCFNIIESSGDLWVGNVPEAFYTVVDSIACIGSTFLFTDGSTGLDPIEEWVWNTGDTVFIDTASAVFNYVYEEPGVYETILTVSTAFGCTDTFTQEVLVIPYPEVNISPDSTICPGFSVPLSAEGGLNYTWAPPDGLTDPFIANPIATPEATTTYSVAVDNGYCASEDSVTITVLEDLIVDIGPDTILCIIDEIQLFGELVSDVPQSEISYEWFPPDGFNNVNILDPVSTTNETIIYYLAASCGTLNDTASAVITVLSPPDVEIGTDTVILIQDQQITLTAELLSVVEPVVWQWSPASEVSCVDCPSVDVSPDVTTIYSVQVTDGSGCSDIDFVYVKVVPCNESILEIPNIITPNNDGRNDVFRIQYEGISEIRVIRIFNRWGELMYETDNIDQAWDGTFNGTICNPGVYVYMIEAICVNGAENIISGNVTLVK
jgi:gliding motility-associated-like protein